MEADANVSSSCNFLSKPLNINDLIGGGAQFDIKSDFDDGQAENLFEEIDFGSDDDNEDDADIDQKQKNLVSPWMRPFDELRTQMQKVEEHIYKLIIHKGKEEEELVPNAARVTLRYSAFWEGEGTPFDSSFLRGTAFTFITGVGEVLEGLEAAVRTMHVGETALFLISYKLLFHELGCPPRIKPRADGLFKIEVLRYDLVGNLEAIDQVPAEERNKFAYVFDKIKQIHLSGLDFFRKGAYISASRAFERAVDALNFCRIDDEAEQTQHTEFLIKLYTNLAICYLKTKAPTKTCAMVGEIKRLSNDKPSCKALFQEGRALSILGDYQNARASLRRARQMEPGNQAIIDELKSLEHTFNRYKKNERDIWTRAMGINSQAVKKVENAVDVGAQAEEDTSEWRETLVEMIEDFQKNTLLDKMPLPVGLGRDGIDVVTELAERLDMSLKLSQLDRNSYTLVKN